MTENLVDSRLEVDSESNSDDASPPTAEEFFKSPGFYKNAQQYWSRINPDIG